MSSSLTPVSIGLFGHIDSGKTSLARTLSTTKSTASLDKNPQSQERGITIDLGFSSFKLKDKYLCTIVDCPGHSSLIKHVLVGSNIVDCVILTIDSKKGIQRQTIECLAIAEIVSPQIIVALTKIDDTPLDKLEKMKTKIESNILDRCRFDQVDVVCIDSISKRNFEQLEDVLYNKIQEIKINRDPGEFRAIFDHCFSIRGSGAVFTSTILSGKLSVGDVVFPVPDISSIGAVSSGLKVKSLQIFREPVDSCESGDRVAICVSRLDSKYVSHFERGLLLSSRKQWMSNIHRVFAMIRPVCFLDPELRGDNYDFCNLLLSNSNINYHVTVGTETNVAKIKLLLPSTKYSEGDCLCETPSAYGPAVSKYSWRSPRDYVNIDYRSKDNQIINQSQFLKDNNGFLPILIEYKQPVSLLLKKDMLFIISRLDLEQQLNKIQLNQSKCRIFFYGFMDGKIDSILSTPLFPREIKVIYKYGKIEKIKPCQDGTNSSSNHTYICKLEQWKKESPISLIENLTVYHPLTLTKGRITGGFGVSGKIRVEFDRDITSYFNLDSSSSEDIVPESCKLKRLLVDKKGVTVRKRVYYERLDETDGEREFRQELISGKRDEFNLFVLNDLIVLRFKKIVGDKSNRIYAM